MGIVRVILSSPEISTWLAELESTIPLTLVPSRSNTVACWFPAAGLLAQETIRKAVRTAGMATRVISTGTSFLDVSNGMRRQEHTIPGKIG